MILLHMLSLSGIFGGDEVTHVGFFCKLFLWLAENQYDDADLFVCVEVLRPSQPNGVMWSAINFA